MPSWHGHARGMDRRKRVGLTTMKKNINLKFLTVALILINPITVANSQEWDSYWIETDRFTALFPGEPEVSEFTWDSEYGAVFPGRRYTVDVNEGFLAGHYVISVIDYTDAFNVHLNRTNKTEADAPLGYEYWRIDGIAAVDYAATQLRRRGGEVTLDAWHHIDRVNGHQIQSIYEDGSKLFAGVYNHRNKVYIIEATIPAGAPPAGMFQQAIRFTDAEGNSVRYDYIPDCEPWLCAGQIINNRQRQAATDDNIGITGTTYSQ
jgi:hypothetical protein